MLFLLWAFQVHGQDPAVDSLETLLDRSRKDTARIMVLNELATLQYRVDPEAALAYSQEAIDLSTTLGYTDGLAAAEKNAGLGQYMLGNYADAVRYWESSLDHYDELGNDKLVANLISNLGSVYYTMGQSERAVEFYIRSLKMAEKIDDKNRIATLLLNIGSVYSEQAGALDTARSYYMRAMEIGEELGYDELLGLGYMNLGQLHFKMEAYDSALHYFETSLDYHTSNIDIAASLNDIGRIYLVKDQYRKAKVYQLDALDLARKEQAQFEVVKILLGLASTQTELGHADSAIVYFDEAKNIARDIGLNYELSTAYEGLAESYADVRDYRNAYKFLALQNDIDNTIYRLEAEDKTQSLMFSYQLDKKQSEIEILEQASVIDQLRSRRQRGMIIATSVFGILIFLLAIGIYNRMRYVRKTNHKIELQKRQIEDQRDEIQAQRDLALTQKEMITDSINYAQRIQSALLPSEEVLKATMPEHFALLKPKDIVSGDFYWVREVQDHLVIFVADCTGHGVPGAFMSMLGITLLNGMISDRCFDAPSAILEQLRAKVKELLDQDGSSDEQKDGMDAALVVLNKRTREVHFAGANNPLYIIRNNEVPVKEELAVHKSLENGAYTLYELKADKQPIGTHWDEIPFRTQSVFLEARDSIYMFSDGFVDQFGGEKRKKFKAANFKKLLLSLQGEPMENQKQHLEAALEEWRGQIEQIDDVSIFGVRLS